MESALAGVESGHIRMGEVGVGRVGVRLAAPLLLHPIHNIMFLELQWRRLSWEEEKKQRHRIHVHTCTGPDIQTKKFI